MASWQKAVRRFFTDIWGTVRLADNQTFSVARFDALPTCTARLEGAEGWVRGGTGVASVTYQCLKSGADAYAWAVLGSGNTTTDLAAHETGQRYIAASLETTYDPPNIVAGGFTQQSFVVTGALTTDTMVNVYHTQMGVNAHLQWDAHVLSTDTVQVTITNTATVDQNVASGTITLLIWRWY